MIPFLHKNQHKICMITTPLLVIITLWVVSIILFDRYRLKRIDIIFRQTLYVTGSRFEKLQCESLSIPIDLHEPKLLINMQFFLHYFAEYNKISGWTTFETFYVVWLFIQFQYKHLQKVDGAIGEIGVHRGKLTSYIYLMRHRDKRQKLFAVDIFAKKALNIDASGDGDRTQFLENVKHYANVSAEDIILYEGSSLNFNLFLSNNSEAERFWRENLGENSCQLVSIDGGHTALLTYSDLCLISNSLIDGGIVMVDDIDNAEWLGVRDGVAQFLAETSVVFDGNSDPELATTINKRFTEPNFNLSCRIVEATRKISNLKSTCSRLIPILQYATKLYLTTPNYYPHYIELLKKLNDKETNFIRYDTLRSTAGSVPIWSDSRAKHPKIFDDKVKPFWLAELVKATQ